MDSWDSIFLPYKILDYPTEIKGNDITASSSYPGKTIGETELILTKFIPQSAT